jgi:ABC-type amino acid transport system permease subunit
MPGTGTPHQDGSPSGGFRSPPAADRRPPAAAARQRAAAALLVALLSLGGFAAFNLGQRQGILLIAYALLAGIVALWLGLTALSRARRDQTARPRGALAAAAIAAIGIGLSTVLLLAFALFGRQLAGYRQCLTGASTISAQQSCYSQLSHALNERIGLLSSSGRG